MNDKQIETYDFKSVEDKWNHEWDKNKIYKTEIDTTKPKYYCLDTFVYPSGKGVTIGHYKSFGGMDVMARYKRMKGFNVLYPTGWDTFGLPAENFAIKSGKHPKDITEENKTNFIGQYKAAGLSYDWDREINTSYPEYYKWTQWLFLVMYKQGLAYRKNSAIDWCPSCKTVIAKEQVIEGNICERCGSEVIQKELMQWFFKVTEHAERLYDDIEKLDWDDKHKNPHRSWIGKKIDEEGSITFNVRDWCISRQRYWGPPIPIIYCDKCGDIPVPEEQLPVQLPYDVDWTPTGESPLAQNENFINAECPNCDGKAKREVDIMDTFVSSAWYQFRFTDPNNEEIFAGKEALNYWGNVDHYQGTIEHLTAHLIYARFVTKVFYDLGFVPFDEPFPKYTPVGLLVDKSGTKYSKRLGNAPDTNTLIENYGGDLLRLSCQFISPFEDITKWGEEDVVGVRKFRDRIWRVFKEKIDGKAHEVFEEETKKLHRLIKDVESNIEQMKYNVALSKMMVFVSELDNRENFIDKEYWETFIKLLAPFAPFIAEEMWHQVGNENFIHLQEWPKYHEKYIQSQNVTIVVQVDGKLRGTISVVIDSKEDVVKDSALQVNKVVGYIKDRYNIIFIPNKIINFVNK